jgi:FHA domain
MENQAPSPVRAPDSIIDSFDPLALPVLLAPVRNQVSEPFRADPPPSEIEITTRRPQSPPLPAGGADQPLVLAVRCPSGHLNEDRAANCRMCGQSVPAQQAEAVPRPRLGRLRLSNGESYPLDRGVIFGRGPTVPAGQAGPRPNAIKLSDDRDVSRNHVEIRLDGWRVLAVDLGSANGTLLSGPNLAAQRLRPGEEEVVEPGSIITLAPDVWITYEVAP